MHCFRWLRPLLCLAALPACHGGEHASSAANDVASQRASAKLAGLSWRQDGALLAAADDTVRSAVERALEQEPGLPGTITVTVNEGVVTLSGNVDNDVVARRAVTLSQDIRGVRAVIERMQVVAPLVDDRTLGRNVESVLARDAALREREISATVRRGRVLLGGTVDSFAEREMAEQAAWGVRGVVQVESRLALAVRDARSDWAIEREIEQRVQRDERLRDDRIAIDVSGGKVVLGGEVGSSAEKRRARLLAWVSGVNVVDDSELAVTGRRAATRERGYEPIPSDAALVAAVRDALRYDPRMPRQGIEIEVSGGKVTLRGSVQTVWVQRLAERDARNTVGVWSVDNALSVKSDELASDDVLLQRVRERLAHHPSVTSAAMEVFVRSGVVVLRGAAKSDFERQQAERAVAQMRGVTAVQNELVLADDESSAHDAELERQIVEAIRKDARIDASAIGVQVRNGVVTLTGKVLDWDAYDAILQHAYATLPRRVQNDLQRTQYAQRPSER